VTIVETERLVLRRWREGDAEPFAAINADPEVTAFVGGPMERAASDALLARIAAEWDDRGYGRAAVEERGTGRLLGFTGLGGHGAVEGAVEIGWRLARDVWGRGYATEAATAMRDLAFTAYGLDRIVSVALPANGASVAVMRKIGMRHWRDVTFQGLDLTVYELEAVDAVG
jgi:RimJ/RimL family protein N-acetyltransferase